MSRQVQLTLKKLATASALLAIYLLTVLTPLHQVAGFQRDLAKLGYAGIEAWSICTALHEADEGDPTPSALKCPVAGVGQHQLLLPGVAVGPIPLPSTAAGHSFLNVPEAARSLDAGRRAWPRAPPVSI